MGKKILVKLKKILKCRVTLFLLAVWAAGSVIGYLGKDTIYKNYRQDVRTTPYFVSVLQGIHDEVYPWSGEKADFWEQWMQNAENPPEGESVADVPGTETEGDATESVDGATEAVEDVTETVEIPQSKEFIEVEEDYFEDAVFIGDSRTVGLHDYSGLITTFYASVGLNVFDMWEDAFCDVDGEKVTLEEALSAQQFKKVYFQIGINEMGRGTIDSFMQAYTASVEKFRELQPDAIIFVQGIMRVTSKKSDSDPVFNNAGINARNERIAELADYITVFYIDVNDAVCDENGALRSDLTFDNLHLYGSKYDIWVDFLKTKGVATE